MVRPKNKSRNKSSKNMHPSQSNNPRRNVNDSDGHIGDMNMQNHNMVPTDVTQNTAITNQQDHNMMVNLVTQRLANLNKPIHNVTSNAMTKLPPQRHSQITMNEMFNNYVGSPNPSNSLFSSGLKLPPQSNFHLQFDYNQINSNNGIHSLQSNIPLINEKDSSDNGQRDNIGSQYSNTTVPVAKPHGKHSLYKKYDHYFSLKKTKTSKSVTNEFKMSNEDFPALPGTQTKKHDVANAPSTKIDSNQQWVNTNTGSKLSNTLNKDQFADRNSSSSHLNTDFHLNGGSVPKPRIKISFHDGKVTNIPSSMLRDQFGIIGHLINMKAAEHEPNLVTLTYGEDFTSLGMKLNSPADIYPTFGGPFEQFPLEPLNIEFDVPPEYRIQHKIKNKLPPIKLSGYKEDLLFYLFYTHFGDKLQMDVAKELHSRGWYFHKEKGLWITPVSTFDMYVVNTAFERGTFYTFDVQLWRKVPKEFIIDNGSIQGFDTNPPFILPVTSTI